MEYRFGWGSRVRLALWMAWFGMVVAGQAWAQDLSLSLVGGDRGALETLGTGSWRVTSQGSGFLAGTDQFAFATQTRSGNFDLQVRLADLEISSPFVRAGLMLRSDANPASPFVAAFASSGPMGCFAEWRTSVSGTPSRASVVGGYPSAPPNTWLRLRRSGSEVTTFASVDGTTWNRLGSVSLGLPDEVLVGLAVASQNPNAISSGRFEGLGTTLSDTEGEWIQARESATPSSRRTGLVLSEIHYHPLGGSNELEFIEISNHGDIFQDLTGWRLVGGVDFAFPAGFRLEAGALVVVAADPTRYAGRTGSTPVLGPWRGSLDNAGDTLELRDNIGAIKLQMRYGSDLPWPVAADGTGHSMVLVSPSYGEEDPRAWAASWRRGGSPGRRDPVSAAPVEPVVINEFLAHTDLPQLDFIELYNRTTRTVDLSGWILTDSIVTNRFRIPNGTRLDPGSHLVFDETALGFRLRAAGETVMLLTPDTSRVADIVRFGGQENGVSSGCVPDGSGVMRRLALPTPGRPNGAVRQEPVVLNEIFYNPPGGDADEFVELFHRGQEKLDLSGWRIRGGIDFDFAPGTVLQPGQFLVIAKDLEQFRSNHGLQSGAVGNYSGTLGNGGDVVRLTRPDEVLSTNQLGEITRDVIHITVGEVRYVDGGSWGKWSDGGGSSLELVDPDADPTLAANWADSDESGKAPWSVVEWTGMLDNGFSGNGINRVHLGLLNDGECLVDDVEVIKVGSTNLLQNPGFENGRTGWSITGNHIDSTVDASGARSGAQGLHLRAQGGLDTGINSIRGTLATGFATGNRVTFRASVRWIAGWPELLFRLRGGFADYAAPLQVPRNLGSPGRANSRVVANAGPAIHQVSHSPALPRAGEPVRVTARVSDPDVVTSLVVRFRVDPGTSLSEVPMRDDGLEGDVLAGDGVFTALLEGRSASLVAFHIAATDGSGATSIWPREHPVDEGLIRWGDTIPMGTFPHVHLWCTTKNRTAVGNALNNAYRRGTLVYGNTRLIHGVLFRDKGSPYHNGSGDIVARVPDDEKLHGVSERLFSKTGNGGVEETGLRGRVSAWIASQMGLPSLSGKYQFFYINGTSFANLVEDQEEPDHRYAEHHQPDNGEGDLYKISIQFDYNDGNAQFNATQATMGRFLSEGRLKLARYRWNWERRAQQFPESDYQTIFDLVEAFNSTPAAGVAARVQRHADMEQWMTVFAFHRVTGNWDSWTYNVGQNMYLYRQPGRPAMLIPWDIDFVLGLGDAAGAALWGGQDSTMNVRAYDNPTFRRMLWRSLLQAAEGPMLQQNYGPVVNAYRTVQLQNKVTGTTSPGAVTNYLNGRRTTILSRYKAADTPALVITSNGGADFTSTTPTVTLSGNAPLRVADIAVNGVRFPVTWTGFTTFSVTVPLTAAINPLQLVGLDQSGNPLADTDSVVVTYPGAIPKARDWVVINEIHYNPILQGSGFVELHNRHPSVGFGLGGHRVDGLGYTFSTNAVIPPGGFLVLAADRAAFATAHGAGIPVFDEFPGTLNNEGERLRLVEPDGIGTFDEVHYRNTPPWPSVADGLGSSLQRIDATQDGRRPANWGASAVDSPVRMTPGAANSVRASLPAFPTVWINEVVPNPPLGVVDNLGQRAPFVELANTGEEEADLSGLSLADSILGLRSWAFPQGTKIPSKGFLRVWLDGQADQTVLGHLHASWMAEASTGSVFLTRLQGSPAAPVVLDWVGYDRLSPERGFGSIPDGDPEARRLLYVPTPGAPNDPSVPTLAVTVNEFMAQNLTGLVDPVDGNHEDWIEVHNAGSQPADLSGYFITDSLVDRTAFRLPPGTVIPPGGFLLLWADGQPSQSVPEKGILHLGFSLARGGEEIGLFAPDLSLVDSVTFGPQTADVSMGRFPDGDMSELIPQEVPTPGTANFIPGGNKPPVFAPVTPMVVDEGTTLRTRVVATDPDPVQTIRYTLGPDAPPGLELGEVSGELVWTPTEEQGPGTYWVTVRATDSGTPPRSATQRVQIRVDEVNQPPVVLEIPDQGIDEGSELSLQIQATDPDRPGQAVRFDLIGAPDGATIDSENGRIIWMPSEAFGGQVVLLRGRVTDGGVPPLSSEWTVRVTVREVDNPPYFIQPSAQIVNEGAELRFQVEAVDPDGPGLIYQLIQGPIGMTVDATRGEIRWRPSEEDGPGSYPVILEATELTALAQTARATFSVVVNEVNEAPTFKGWSPSTRLEGEVVDLPLIASDEDLPPQDLSFSIVGDVVGTAFLDLVERRIRWTLPRDVGAKTLSLTVEARDGGTPSQSSRQTAQVLVEPVFRVLISEILYRPTEPGAAYVELQNPSAFTAWDVSGCQLLGGALEYRFPEGTVLGPGGVACIGADTAVFRRVYGTPARLLGAWTGVLGESGDDLRLISPKGEVLDRVVYSTKAPWPVGPAAGIALQVIDPWQDNAAPGNWLASEGYTGPQQLVPMNATWRYFETGTPVGVWQAPEFDDRAWKVGEALFFKEEATLPGPKTTPLPLGQITYYFRTSFVMPLVPTGAEIDLTHIVDDGAVFYLNGKEWTRFNMPADPLVTPTTLATPSVGDAEKVGPTTLPGGLLRGGTNVLAVEVHQSSAGSSDLVFGAQLDLKAGAVAGRSPGVIHPVGT
ncbi:MAG: lamin tail domain-containing protein, partial [Limisphaerales bacterium]